MSLIDDLLALDRPLLVALDVDGTIAPIVREPEHARIPEQTLCILDTLARSPSIRLALITGRALDSLGRMEQLGGIWRAVEHGGVVLAPGERPQPKPLAEEHERALTLFREWAREHAKDAFVENKPRAVAVHVRSLAERDPRRANAVLAESEELAIRLGLHVRRGRCVREAEAIEHDKGEALREIFERSGARSTFFVGDDVTDFPAIEFANNHGVGAFVISPERPQPPSTSIVAMEDTRSVAALLDQLSRRLV